jgi:hypothetical protein
MWAEAAKWALKFSEGVLNAVDASGYPISVRQLSLPYDAATGTMPVVLPPSLGAVEGPASLLCHFHDEKLWSLRMALLKGRLERRDGTWVFVTTSFTPPSPLRQIRDMSKTTQRYLEQRNLPMPKVDFAAVERMWTRAREIKDP